MGLFEPPADDGNQQVLLGPLEESGYGWRGRPQPLHQGIEGELGRQEAGGRRQGSGRSQRQPHESEGRQEVWVSQKAGVKLPVEPVGGCPGAEGRHDGQASSLQAEKVGMVVRGGRDVTGHPGSGHQEGGRYALSRRAAGMPRRWKE
jgi:hypothetical protein